MNNINIWEKIKKPVIGLAPMDGVTDEPMRQIQCSVTKPDVIYTEFVSAEGFCKKPSAFEKTLFFKENERPIIVQVFGYTPQAFYDSISELAKRGFDGIDINMGCPAKSVIQKGGGGDLIENYDLSEKIINSCLKAISYSKKNIPLSIKTRIGKNKIVTDKWIAFLADFPIAEVTVHGRLLNQERSGEVYWDEIKKASQILKRKNIVCLGNGGIKSIKEGQDFSVKYGLDGVLIGQAALGNPWVFKEDYVALKEDILAIILKHAKLVEAFYTKDRFVTIRKHFGWYPKGFPNCIKLKTELLKTSNYSEVKSAIAKFAKI